MNKPDLKSSLAGDIPIDWECVKLESLVSNLVSGVSVSGEDRVPQNSEKKLLKVSAVTSGKFDRSAYKAVDTKTGARLKRKVESNTILVNRANGSRSLVGSAVYISDVTDTLYFPDKIWKITPNSATGNGPFLGHLLSSNRFRSKVIARCSGGTGMMNIGSKSYLGIRIASPPLPEQKKIAEILGTWDRAIETQQKLIDSLTRRKKALMQQLLTGKTRLPGFDDEWNTSELSDLFSRITETAGNETPRVLSITAGTGFVDQRQKFSKVIAGKNIEKYIQLQKGDFSYNKGNSKRYPMGCVYQLHEFEDGVVPNVFYSFRNKGEVHSSFYKFYFEAGFLNHQLSRCINSGVRNDGLLNLRAADFFKSNVPQPCIEEQQSIAKVLTAADQEIKLHTTHLTSLRTQKRGLMQQLLTGKTRTI